METNRDYRIRARNCFSTLKPSLVALVSPDLTFVDSERKVSATVFMRRCFSFWIHWLLLAVIFSGAVAIVPPRVLSGSKAQSATLVLETTHPGHSDKLFTKPSSVAQEFLLREEWQNKQPDPLVCIQRLFVQQQRQKQQTWHSQPNPALLILFFFQRKIAPPSPTDGPFLS